MHVSASERRVALAVLAVLTAVLAVQRLHTYDEPLERDITTYAVIGREALSGRWLYSDLWDNKSPLVFATYAAGELVAGYGPSAIFTLGVARRDDHARRRLRRRHDVERQHGGGPLGGGGVDARLGRPGAGGEPTQYRGVPQRVPGVAARAVRRRSRAPGRDRGPRARSRRSTSSW